MNTFSNLSQTFEDFYCCHWQDVNNNVELNSYNLSISGQAENCKFFTIN